MKMKSGFPVLYPNAAGIDISSKEHFVAVDPSIDDHPSVLSGVLLKICIQLPNGC